MDQIQSSLIIISKKGSGIRSELTESHRNSSISEGSETNLVLQNLNIFRNLSENRPKFAQYGWDRIFLEIESQNLGKN